MGFAVVGAAVVGAAVGAAVVGTGVGALLFNFMINILIHILR